MSKAAELAHRLGEQAEAACRHYLPNGRKQGRYWLVGDVAGAPGRSLYVRLSGERAGKWIDYVALLVMLRICDCAPSYGRMTVFLQHNCRALREVA